MFVCLGHGWVGYSFLFSYASVISTRISMYMHVHDGITVSTYTHSRFLVNDFFPIWRQHQGFCLQSEREIMYMYIHVHYLPTTMLQVNSYHFVNLIYKNLGCLRYNVCVHVHVHVSKSSTWMYCIWGSSAG